jgi:DNA-binding transcriptional LysR family regulator
LLGFHGNAEQAHTRSVLLEQFANTLFGQAEQTVVTGQDSGLSRLLAVPSGVELRQLEAFVAVATELHFGRAAERLHLAALTLSELIRRLERELGTPLFTRTTRRVALTSAGAELLARSKGILDEIAAADAAVRRVADGEAGTVRLGITPPVAPVLAPHLISRFTPGAPQVTVDVQRMWLPALADALTSGRVDVVITCGLIPAPDGIANEVFCAEPLLVGLRPEHRLAGQAAVALTDLAHDVLGTTRRTCSPAGH